MTKSILAGVIGTAIMTAIVMIVPMMGMPKMSPPHMLAGMIGMPVAVGWAMHFMIGIVFALAYTYFFKINMSNLWVKGAIFGVIAFAFSQVGMMIMMNMMPMPPMEGSMAMIIMGRLIGHVVFGIAVAQVVGQTPSVNNKYMRAT